MSLFLIVMVSVLLGSALPFGFARAGVDPAHAGTSIQVGAACGCLWACLLLRSFNVFGCMRKSVPRSFHVFGCNLLLH